jgi:hypothetical protein
MSVRTRNKSVKPVLIFVTELSLYFQIECYIYELKKSSVDLDGQP